MTKATDPTIHDLSGGNNTCPSEADRDSEQQYSVTSGRPRFNASRTERFCALLSYVTAYFYILAFDFSFTSRIDWLFLVVCGGIVIITELLNRDRKRTTESFVWLGCFAICAVRLCFDLDSRGAPESIVFAGAVWNWGEVLLFTHVFCVWWVLSRSGTFLEGQSGHLFPADALNGFIRFPFGNFFLRIKTVGTLFTSRTGAGSNRRNRWWTLLAAALCTVLFFIAAGLLKNADESFAGLLNRLRFRLNLNFGDFWHDFIFSLPVGCWLYSLMAGSRRCSEETLEKQRGSIYTFLNRIRRVPAMLWVVVTCFFTVLYLAFFIMQGSYLFGAFTRTLPEGFIVSQYAREGFFELCRVIAVNFTLLWLVTRMADGETRETRLFRAVCIAILAESMLFAVIAFSKLALYISCFGFTPLRIKSTWLVCVLFAGCVCWTVNIFTEKPLFRMWMLIGASSLALLTVL